MNRTFYKINLIIEIVHKYPKVSEYDQEIPKSHNADCKEEPQKDIRKSKTKVLFVCFVALRPKSTAIRSWRDGQFT